jgi:RecB family exonuclease
VASGGDASARRGDVRVGLGARAVESLLLGDLSRRIEAQRRDSAGLARPIRVVVPSRSLREHLSTAILDRVGHAVAGVRIQTLHGLAREIVERAAGSAGRGEALLPILVRRAAMREPALRAALEGLHDGYGVVAGTVRDLLDAGFAEAHAAALAECVPGGGSEQRRARAVLAVASATRRAFGDAGLEWRTDLVEKARRHLERDPERALPSSAVLVHGFADATAVVTDLIVALCEQRGAVVYLDRPPDPIAPERTDAGVSFSARFTARLTGSAGSDLEAAEMSPAPEVQMLRAPGAHAETRAVANRISALLAAGTPPERIGVVARQLAPYAVPIRVQFGRLGVPFSGIGTAGPTDPSSRRVLGLVELLRRGEDAPADHWLGLLGEPLLPRTRRADVRVALHSLGAARLRDVAALDLLERFGDRTDLALPVRRGLEETEDGARATRRRVSRAALEPVAGAARRLVARLSSWPDQASLAGHVERACALVSDDLGWGDDLEREAHSIFRSLAAECGAGVRIDYRELVLLAEGAIASSAAAPIGGRGGGVQVLDATEARSRSFDQLFVLGLNRDAFPRVIEEDALLPDAHRQRMAEVLPQIPIKRTGFDEERFLFAELLSSSPSVTLSWLKADDDGKPRAPSPLVVRLGLGRPGVEVTDAPSLHARPPRHGEDDPVRPAHDHVLSAGLHASRGAYRDRLPVALREALEEALGDAPDEAADPGELEREAEVRIALLDELDPDLRTRNGRTRMGSLGPYFGFVGAPVGAADPRGAPLYATTAEGMAGCPWRTFLTRVLRVEPPPDALDALPTLDSLLVGATVHGALERLGRGALTARPEDLEAAATAEAVELEWPTEAALDSLLLEAAEGTLVEAGLALVGLARALALRARPFLDAARERAEVGEVGPTLLGVELPGETRVEALDLELRFRADRVDRVDERLVVTDYKTGRPISKASTPKTRRKNLLEQLLRGSALQAAVYAFSHSAPVAQGRYVYLDPEIDEDRAIAAIAADDDEARSCFEQALARVIGAWRSGSFFPRLLDPRGRPFSECEWCAVRTACLLGDSGARRRLERWTSEREAGESPAESSLLELWRLPLEKLEPRK